MKIGGKMSDSNVRRVTRHERNKVAEVMKANFDRAASKGIPEGSVRGIITGVLGFEPTEVDFRQILFKAKYRTSDDGSIFYGIKYGPKKPKQLYEETARNAGQSLTYEGGDLHLMLKGKDKNGNKVDVSLSPVKKVLIILSTLLLAVFVCMVSMVTG